MKNGLFVEALQKSGTFKNLGFGTCILGLFDADKVGKLVGVAADQEVSAMIAVGKQIKDAPLPQRKGVDELLSVK